MISELTATTDRPKAPARSDRKPCLLVAQLGARMHYAVPRILWRAGMLAHFYSDLCAVQGWPRLLSLVPGPWRPAPVRRLLGRMPHDVPVDQITTFTVLGCRYAWRLARARSADEVTAVNLWAGRTFAEQVSRGHWGAASGVYAFNGAALETLRAARQRGLQAILEQTIAPCEIRWRLLREEREAFPQWRTTSGRDVHAEQVAARQHAEWNAADLIVCGSKFVRDGIAGCGGPHDRCAVVPYGVDCTPAAPAALRRRRHRRLRVLTVGCVDLRKGAPYVLAAAQRLRADTEFRMVGSVNVGRSAEAELRRSVQLVGPVPRAEIAAHYRWADVFLLPSLCEGSATVVYEALGAGLPVICTPNTGSVVRDGIDGFVVPVRDVDAIVDRIGQLASRPQLHCEISNRARRRATRFTVDQYARRLLHAITSS